MPDYTTSLKSAHRNVLVADHMLTQTYPLVKDAKLLLAVMDNVFLGLSHSLDSLLFYMRDKKLIPPFHDSFDSKYNTFKLNIAKKFDFSSEEINLILDVKKLIEELPNDQKNDSWTYNMPLL